MCNNLVVIISFDQDKEMSKEFYQKVKELSANNPSFPVIWQRPSRSIGAIESIFQVLGQIDYSGVALDIAVSVIGNAVYDLIKRRKSNKIEKVVPIEIVFEGRAEKVVVHSSMTMEQVRNTINSVADAVLNRF